MKSFKTGKDINAYRFVKITDNTIEMATSPTDNIIGISESVNASANDVMDISLIGEDAEIEAGGAFLAGDALTCDSEGRAVKATSTDNIGAIATSDSAEAGQIANCVVVIQRVISATTETQE